MKILLLGGQGQLATDLAAELRARGHELQIRSHAELDIGNAREVAAQVSACQPACVINAAAFTQVEQCEAEPERAYAVNAVGASNVANAAQASGARSVYFSTDYVFGGPRSRPWRETDTPQPLNQYGKSKLAGEAMAAVNPRHFILRVSGLYGLAGSRGKGGNFVEAMLRRAQSGEPIAVVNDQILAPTYTAHLAPAVADLIVTSQYGLYHLSAAGECSWFEFARELFRQAKLEPQLRPVSSTEYGSPVRRPAYSVLDNTKYLGLGFTPIPDWRRGLSDYLALRRKRGTGTPCGS